MKSMVKDVSEWCMRSLVCKVKEVSSKRLRLHTYNQTIFLNYILLDGNPRRWLR